jgi:hypothetical protein
MVDGPIKTCILKIANANDYGLKMIDRNFDQLSRVTWPNKIHLLLLKTRNVKQKMSQTALLIVVFALTGTRVIPVTLK